MSRTFSLPDLGEGLTEAEIIAVLVHEGDVIREDAPLLEVETDKAQVEIPSPIGGRVEKIHVAPGQTVKVGALLVTFADSGAPAVSKAPPSGPAPGTTAAAAPPARSTTRSPAAPAPAPAQGPVAATPATRRIARELGVDLRTVTGTGAGGRVLETDVRSAAAGPRGAPAAPAAESSSGPAKPLATVGLEPPPLPRLSSGGRWSAWRSPTCAAPSPSAWPSRPR